MAVRALLALSACLLAVPGSAERPRAQPAEPGPASAAELAALARGAPDGTPRPMARPTDERRCAPDGATCIARATYDADVCRTIEAAAVAEGLDVGFFARLLWQESLFDAAAISPAGAQGIAQFMPATAEREGLGDPFNPAEAILASADYLKRLEREFGNLGLAAAAYNAGEARVVRWLVGTSTLPGETRHYVSTITGHPAETWRDGTPEGLDLRLDPDQPFQEACLARAAARAMPSLPEAAPVLLPWGVVIAAQDSRAATDAQVARVQDTHGALLADERIDHVRARVPGVARARHVAQIGRDTREDAEALCRTLQAARAACMVLRN